MICLDEFEELSQRSDQFTNDLYDSWRHLMNENAIAFITASKVPLSTLANSGHYTSPFFNVLMTIPLGELAEDEALELINRGFSCDRPFSQGDGDRLHSMAGNHPYKIQLAGSLIYQAKGTEDDFDLYWVQQQFARQISSIGLGAPITHSLSKTSTRFLMGPMYLGRAILESIFRVKSDKIAESNALILGWTVTLLVLALILVKIFQ